MGLWPVPLLWSTLDLRHRLCGLHDNSVQRSRTNRKTSEHLHDKIWREGVPGSKWQQFQCGGSTSDSLFPHVFDYLDAIDSLVGSALVSVESFRTGHGSCHSRTTPRILELSYFSAKPTTYTTKTSFVYFHGIPLHLRTSRSATAEFCRTELFPIE